MHIYVLIHPESSLGTTAQTAIPNHLESIVLLISNDELHHYEMNVPSHRTSTFVTSNPSRSPPTSSVFSLLQLRYDGRGSDSLLEIAIASLPLLCEPWRPPCRAAVLVVSSTPDLCPDFVRPRDRFLRHAGHTARKKDVAMCNKLIQQRFTKNHITYGSKWAM